jgi:hypothetical protein
MRIAVRVVRGLVGITGIAQLVLGIVFWTGHAKALIPLHMAIGLAFVVGLVTLAVLCARAGAPVGLAAVASVWALLVLALGMTQMQILPGPAHWVVQVVHVLVGIVAMGLGARLQRAAAGRGGAAGALAVEQSSGKSWATRGGAVSAPGVRRSRLRDLTIGVQVPDVESPGLGSNGEGLHQVGVGTTGEPHAPVANPHRE